MDATIAIPNKADNSFFFIPTHPLLMLFKV